MQGFGSCGNFGTLLARAHLTMCGANHIDLVAHAATWSLAGQPHTDEQPGYGLVMVADWLSVLHQECGR
jgi:hypothetical protein